jgi:flagellar biogenesis protein FliO
MPLIIKTTETIDCNKNDEGSYTNVILLVVIAILKMIVLILISCWWKAFKRMISDHLRTRNETFQSATEIQEVQLISK